MTMMEIYNAMKNIFLVNDYLTHVSFIPFKVLQISSEGDLVTLSGLDIIHVANLSIVGTML